MILNLHLNQVTIFLKELIVFNVLDLKIIDKVYILNESGDK